MRETFTVSPIKEPEPVGTGSNLLDVAILAGEGVEAVLFLTTKTFTKAVEKFPGPGRRVPQNEQIVFSKPR